jgi:hypothetical protein
METKTVQDPETGHFYETIDKPQTTIKLDRQIDKEALYFIDWSKLKDINDLVLIIASLGISLSPTHPAWSQIEHLMDLDRPIKQGEPQPELKKVELPKLKMVKK